jgi:hypothetical protein
MIRNMQGTLTMMTSCKFLVVAVALLAGCQSEARTQEGKWIARSEPAPNLQSGKGVETQPIKMHASWAEWFRSGEALRGASDFAVHVRVSDVGQPQPISLRRDVVLKPQAVLQTPVVMTATVEVQEVVWKRSPGVVVPNTLQLRQTGGMREGVVYPIEGDPLVERGQDYVVFLKEVAPTAYRIVGGPSGRFVVEGDTVVPVAKNGLELAPGTTISALASLR